MDLIDKVFARLEWQGECLVVVTGTDDRGYGIVEEWRGGVRVRVHKAHRVVYAQHFGKDAIRNREVRHTCDNPPCCNPEHLLAGTHAENMQDMAERGRGRKITQGRTHCVNGHALTPPDVSYRKNGAPRCLRCERGGPVQPPKTHCKNGHEYTEENTYYIPAGGRDCRTCRADRMVKFKAKRSVGTP